ncbi:MAG: SulP family inorganic anion transporter [Candidatus Saccharimonadales bacterium]
MAPTGLSTFAVVLLVTFGLIGVGKLIIKMPESIVLGFTAGMPSPIIAGQLNPFFGLVGIIKYNHFTQNFMETIAHLTTLNLQTVIIGALSILMILNANSIKSCISYHRVLLPL